MRSSRARRTAALAVSFLATACSRTPDTAPHMVSEWMHTLYGAIRVERLSPNVASRLMVYATTALYSGLAAGTPSMRPLEGTLNGLAALPRGEGGSRYDATVTAVAAERVVIDSLLREGLPTTRSALGRLADSLDAARLALGVPASTATSSRELGARIGLAIVAWSRTDGFTGTRGRPLVMRDGPGLWVNDAPATLYATQNISGASQLVDPSNPANIMQAGAASDRGLILSRPKKKSASLPAVNMAGESEPYWGELRPFVLSAWNDCAVPQPPGYGTDTSAELYRNAREVQDIRQTLTPEQKKIALYWADNAGESGTPIGHWTAIATQIVSERHLSAPEAARLMVTLSAAQADAMIATWAYKYQYFLIRPRTYIRRVMDSTWEPLIPTPPFPEYPSGHSALSAASSEVMTAYLGAAPFEDSTGLAIGNDVRKFESFKAAANEAGISRVYGGIHFPYGNLGGRALGECIGAKTVAKFGAPNTK